MTDHVTDCLHSLFIDKHASHVFTTVKEGQKVQWSGSHRALGISTERYFAMGYLVVGHIESCISLVFRQQ